MPAHYGKAKGTTRPKRKPAMGIKPKPVAGGSGRGEKKTATKKPSIKPGKPKRPIGDVPSYRDPEKNKYARADSNKKPTGGTKRTQLPFPKPRGRR
jgi:hypothetical protein